MTLSCRDHSRGEQAAPASGQPRRLPWLAVPKKADSFHGPLLPDPLMLKVHCALLMAAGDCPSYHPQNQRTCAAGRNGARATAARPRKTLMPFLLATARLVSLLFPAAAPWRSALRMAIVVAASISFAPTARAADVDATWLKGAFLLPERLATQIGSPKTRIARIDLFKDGLATLTT